MKMLRIILLLTFLWFHCAAQQIQITSGSNFTTSSNSSEDLIFKGDTSGYFMINNSVSIKKGELFLYKIDNKSSQKILEKEIWFSYSGTLTIVSAFFYNDKVNLFVQVNNSENKIYLMKHEFNAISGIEIGTAVEIDRFESLFETDVFRNFVIKISSDNSKMIILREEETTSREQIVNAKVLKADDYKVIWEQKLNSNSEDAVPFGKDYLLNNNGYLFYSFYSGGINQFGIQGIYNDSKLNKKLILTKDSVTISEIEIELINDQLICSGEILAGKNKSKLLNPGIDMGFFLLNINPVTLEIKNKSFEFIKQRIQNKLTYSYKNNNYKFEGIKSFYYGNKIYKHYKTYYFKDCFYVIKYHGYKDDEEVLIRNEIIIIKYKNFKQEWMQIIPGKNSCKQKMGFEFIFSDKLNLIYFDHKDNLVRYPDPGFYNSKKYKAVREKSAILVKIGIDDKGILERENIYTYVDWHFEMGSNNLLLNNGKSLVLSTYSGKKRRMDLLRVD